MTNTTHDYTSRYWGHDYAITKVIEDGQQLEVMGWGHGLSKGDFLLLQNGTDSTRYQIKRVKYFTDPKDMWSANLLFAPRIR
jgi:hypothetical protein